VGRLLRRAADAEVLAVLMQFEKYGERLRGYFKLNHSQVNHYQVR
jgi:hypothetical protein